MIRISEYLNKHKEGKLLAILPHADDASFVSGGLFQVLQESRIETKLLCLTGKAKTENYEFMDILGIDSAEFLDNDYGSLLKTRKKWSEEIKNKIEEFVPDILLTFDPHGVTGHPDHIISSVAILDILKQLKEKPELIWRIADDDERKYFDKGHSLHLTITPTFYLNLRLSQSITKLKAIFSHKEKFTSLTFKMQVLEWYLFDHKELYYLVDTKKDKFKVVLKE